MGLSSRLPDFPWDSLAGAKALANRHPDGMVDLSVGTPVDPTPQLARGALCEHSDAPGYPTVWGTHELRQGIINYLVTRWDSPVLDEACVMPTIGSKELVAWLPLLLNIGPGDLVVIPEVAYPTYRVGADLVGARVQACDSPDRVIGEPKLIWINSPGNPTGQIWTREQTRSWIEFARSCGALLVADECYGEFGWDSEPVSVLEGQMCDGDPAGLLAVHSLSKRSNLAGYRGGFVAGDPGVVTELVSLRKHLGMIVPGPVQAAMTVLLSDQTHVEEQRRRYLHRRQLLSTALIHAGFKIDHSQGSLYLWSTRGEDCRLTTEFLAGLGILVAPGDFYGPAGSQHVRIALTATDERIQSAAERLHRI